MSGLGRKAWSTKYQESMMAVGLGTRQAADEEARAEVEVSLHPQHEFRGEMGYRWKEMDGMRGYIAC